MKLVTLPEPESKSDQAYIEILRGLLDCAFENKMTFLSVDVVVDGQIRSVSITSPIDKMV